MKILTVGLGKPLLAFLQTQQIDFVSAKLDESSRLAGVPELAHSDVLAVNLVRRPGLPGEIPELRQVRPSLSIIGFSSASFISESRQRIDFLDSGGDVLFLEPTHPEEFLANARALARQVDRQPKPIIRNIEWNGHVLCMDDKHKRAFVNGILVELTSYEWKILALLAETPGKVIKTAELADLVGCSKKTNTLEALICYIRAKLDSITAGARAFIHTEPGCGYRLNKTEEPTEPSLPRRYFR